MSHAASLKIELESGERREIPISRDPRSLGVALRRIEMQRGKARVAIDAGDSRLTEGFHSYEPDAGIRWTNGCATLPADLVPGGRGALKLVLTLGGATRYLELGAAVRAA